MTEEQPDDYAEMIDTNITQVFAEFIPRKIDFEPNIKTLISGFPGAGLVGSIASRHIAYELEMDVIGYIRSPLIPPQATFFDGYLTYPLRIYSKKDFDIAVLVSEAPISERAHFYIANAVLSWLEDIKAQELIILDAYSSTSDNNDTFLIAEPDLWKKGKKIEKIKAALPEEKDLGTGYIGGVGGAILNESIINKNIDAFALLAPVQNTRIPSPRSSAKLISMLNEYKNLTIDTNKLIEHANRIERSLSQFARKQEEMQMRDQTRQETGLYY